MKALVLVALLLVTVALCAHQQQETFDFFVLVTEWDPNVTSQFFTIHGLWPQFNNGSHPISCPGPQFNINAIQDLIPVMNQVWPSNNGNNSGLWGHEWDKHGLCSNFDENTYFQTTVNLHAKYDVKAFLTQAGITPSPTELPASSIVSAITNTLGVTPALNCYNSSTLAEVGVCFDQTLRLVNCPTMSYYFICPPEVYYNQTKQQL